jgi:hypothetical protein
MRGEETGPDHLGFSGKNLKKKLTPFAFSSFPLTTGEGWMKVALRPIYMLTAELSLWEDNLEKTEGNG